MHIVSNFHDYYDCILREGGAGDRVWVRHPEAIRSHDQREEYGVEAWPFPGAPPSENFRFEGCIFSTVCMIGFCGRIYPLLCYGSSPRPRCQDAPPVPLEEPEFLWSLDDVDGFYRRLLGKKHWTEYAGKPRQNRWSMQARHAAFFEEIEAKQAQFAPLFVTLNTPVFAVFRGESFLPPLLDRSVRPLGALAEPLIVRNAPLKPLRFMTRFDPHQAFQEIEMFFGSVLLGSDGHKAKYKGALIEPRLDDRTMAEAKGFDEWSFRKEPTKKRKRKK